MLDISSSEFCGQMRRSEINQCYNLQINTNMDRSGTFAASNFEVEIEKLAPINNEKAPVPSVKAQQTEMSKRCAWGENAGLRWYKR